MYQPPLQNWFISHSQEKLLIGQMQELRNSGTLCDITLVVDATRIQAHRIVLSAACPYFRAMFTSAFSEANTKEVPVKGVHGDALQSIVDFFYKSQIYIFDGNAEDILRAASLLQIEEVQKYCCSFLESRLNPTNCLGIICIADALSCRDLQACALNYATVNLLAVSNSEEFLIMEPSLLSRIVSKKDLYVNLEEDLYKVLIKWVKHDVMLRKSHLFQLMKKVRFPLLGLTFLSETVECDNLIKENAECCELVANAKTYLESFKKTFGLWYTVVFTASSQGLMVTDHFDVGNVWRTVAFPVRNVNHRLHALASAGDSVYVVFGSAPPSNEGHCLRYTHSTGEWTQLRNPDGKPRNVFLGYHKGLKEMVSLNGYLYFIPNENATSIPRYDPRTDTWAKLSLRQKFGEYDCLVAFNSCIYLFGTGGDHLSIHCYDTATNTKKKMSCTLDEESFNEALCAAVFKDKIYVVCVTGRKLQAMVFNTEAGGEWFDCVQLRRSFYIGRTDLPKCKQYRMIVLNAKLYVIGAVADGPGAEALVEVFDEARQAWRMCKGLNVPNTSTFFATVTSGDVQDSTPRNARVETHLVRKETRRAGVK